MSTSCYDSVRGRAIFCVGLVVVAFALCGGAVVIAAGVPIDKLVAFDNPRAVPGMKHTTHGYLQFALLGRKSTTLHIVAPPGWKCPPHNHPDSPYECITIVTRGTLVMVQRLPNGLLRRRAFNAGDAFLWPETAADYYGFENPSARQSCEFFMVYVPAFPNIDSPLDGLAWIQAGAPQTGPPPGFKPTTDPYPR
ncbi:MAG: hypothetical protein H5T86_07025 [Armatimonadetes bacterium]|nr:hypothetical protein [Armatimonadota bacterium]